MRILHLTSHLNVGGVTTHVVTVAQRLRARGHEVVVASGDGAYSEELVRHGVPHWRVPLATSAEVSWPVAWSLRHLLHRLRAHPVDLVHAHTRVAQVVAHGLCRWGGVPYVTTWHGYFRPRWFRRLLPCVGRLTIAISDPVAQHLQHAFHVRRERIRIILHGVDGARFSSVTPEDSTRLRRQLALGPGPIVGTMSRLVRDKSVEQLLEAFQQVRAARPDAQLLIVGDGPDRARLTVEAERLGLTPSVRFAGALPEASTALAVMDVFVFVPATKEGFGLSLLEAMAGARPIVAIRQGGGAAWVLEQSQVGVQVAPRDPQALAGAVMQFIRDPEAARAAGRRAQDIARSRYSFDREVEQIERVYAEIRRNR